MLDEKKKNILVRDNHFKMIFGSNENIHILAAFLSFYLDVPYENLVKNISLLKQEIDEEVGLPRQSVDVLVRMPDGSKIQIEMNGHYRSWLNNRNFLYALRNYVLEYKTDPNDKQGKKELVYKRPVRYLQINFDNFDREDAKPLEIYKVQTEDGKPFVNNFEIHTINIPKSKAAWYNGDEEKLNRWASLFFSVDEKEFWEIVGEDLMAEEAKKELRNAVEIIKKGDPGWWDYELDAKIQEACLKDDLREEMLPELREEAYKQAIEEVTNEVREEVTHEITEKVTNEVTEKVTNEVTEKVTNEVTEKVTSEVTKKVTYESKLETAKNFKNLGIDLKIISEATSLSIEEIEKL